MASLSVSHYYRNKLGCYCTISLIMIQKSLTWKIKLCLLTVLLVSAVDIRYACTLNNKQQLANGQTEDVMNQILIQQVS